MLLHVPPAGESLSDIVEPAHTLYKAAIIPGCVFTVTIAVTVQVEVAYCIVALPGAIPETTPVPPTDTIPAPSGLLQAPPVVPSLKVIDNPAHTAPAPEIAAGVIFTVVIVVVKQPAVVT